MKINVYVCMCACLHNRVNGTGARAHKGQRNLCKLHLTSRSRPLSFKFTSAIIIRFYAVTSTVGLKINWPS
jgi:hypothetical protein